MLVSHARVAFGMASRPAAVMPKAMARATANRRGSAIGTSRRASGDGDRVIGCGSLSVGTGGGRPASRPTLGADPGPIPGANVPNRTRPRYQFPFRTTPHRTAPTGPPGWCDTRGVSGTLRWPRGTRRASVASSAGRAAVALAQSAEHRIVAPKVRGSRPLGHPNLPDRGVITRRPSRRQRRRRALHELELRRPDLAGCALAEEAEGRLRVTSPRLPPSRRPPRPGSQPPSSRRGRRYRGG